MLRQSTRDGRSVPPWALALFLCLLLVPLPVRADISVNATVSPQQTEVGQPLMLSIDISGAQGVSAPSLGNINGFDVQYVGPSTQISIINGRMSASVQHRYSLTPLRQGHFTLGPFTVMYDGKQYRTGQVTVDVGAASGQPAANQPPNTAAHAGSGANRSNALHLALSAPYKEVYLHQRIPLDVTLTIGGVHVSDVHYPTLAGDGLSLEKFPQPRQSQQTTNGHLLQVFTFHTTATPLRSGVLTVGPAEMELSILRQRRDMFFNDPFFNQFMQNSLFNTERHPVQLHSQPVTLQVLPLPTAGKPSDFSGAVGTFTMQVTASPTTLNAGDPITMHMTIAGTGNLSDATAPQLSRTTGFRTYNPQVDKAQVDRKVFEQVLIPNDATLHTIPPLRFSYFDPSTRRYQTLSSQPIALVVRPPQQQVSQPVIAGNPAGGSIPSPEKLGRDIVYIKDDPGHLAAPGDVWYRSTAFLLWQPIPLLLLGAAVWYDRRRQRLRGDVRYARFTRAGKKARHGLAAAEQVLTRGDPQVFYDIVSRSMQEYLAAKLDLPRGNIDIHSVQGKGIPAECLQELEQFFTTCEQVRFAPASSDGDMRGTLALAQQIVKRLERERRAAPNGQPRTPILTGS